MVYGYVHWRLHDCTQYRIVHIIQNTRANYAIYNLEVAKQQIPDNQL